MLKVLLDAGLIFFSFILAYFVRFKVLLLIITPGTIILLEKYIRVLLLVVLIWLGVFKWIGLYEDKKYPTLIDELAALFLGVTFSTLLLVSFLFLYREFWFSRLVVANAWWISLILLGSSRLLYFGGQALLRLKGWGVTNTLIVGAGEVGQVLALKITRDKISGYRILGFLDDAPEKAGLAYHGVKVLGKVPQIGELVRQLHIREIIIAAQDMPMEKVLDIITECEKYGVGFKLVPGILELIATRLDVDELGGIPLLTVSEIQLKGLKAAVKRLTDIVLSAIGIILLSPFFLLFALLVKLTSPGPVLFLQERVGMEGKTFPMYKFRSMVKDAEKILPEIEHLSEAEGHLFKIKQDPRVTPLGKFMRRWSIDEFPQLFNVLFGHMSLVGPRPPLPREVKNYSAWHRKRLRVRPGITGLWQVSGRSLLPFEEMVRLDIYYIENWSLWLDIKILLRTGAAVFTGSGAY